MTNQVRVEAQGECATTSPVCTTQGGGGDFDLVMKRAIASSSFMLVATLLWGGLAVSGAGPWATDSAAVLSAQLVALAAISIVGMLIGASRWARRLSIIVVAAGLAMAVIMPIGPVWVAAVIFAALALFGLAGNATLGVVRKLPAASGPTPRVVTFTLALAALPGLVAAVSPDGLSTPEWLVIGAGALAAGLYSKAAPFALVAVRAGFPLVTVAAAVLSGIPRGLMWLVLGVAVGAAGWTKEARVAVRPLVEQGRAIPMLPEMVPRDILDAAGVDERGRPLA
jgi:hypothetical protein